MKSGQKDLSVAFLYDDTLDSTDGVAQYVKTLGAWLNEQGHSVSYLVGETKMGQFAGGEVYSLSKNQTVNFNGNRLSIPLPANRRKIKQVLSGQRFDVVHVQVPYSPFMAKHVLAELPAQTAVVGTFHIYPSALWADIGARFLRLLLNNSLRKIDYMLAVSPPAAAFAQKTFGISAEVLPNMVDVARFIKSTKKIKKDGKQIVFLGRLVERKGCEQLLKAFNQLIKTMPEVSLTIAGDGPLRHKLERYVQQKGLDKDVKFLGYISEENKAALLSSADIACFPSLYGESFGIVLIEAMAAGARVVLGGNNPGYASVLGEQKELLVNPKDTKQFTNRSQLLLTDNQLAEKLHKWQSAQIVKYDVKTVGPQIEKIYHAAIAKHHKSRHN